MSDRHAFSTGPIENQLDSNGTIAKTVWIKAENNESSKSILVRLRVFQLDGTITLIAQDELMVNPGTSELRVIPLADEIFEYEVQYDVDSKGALVAVFSKDANGNLIAAQRVLNREFTPIQGGSNSYRTGLIDNPQVAGVRASETIDVLLTNDDAVPIDVTIYGFYVNGTTKTPYVLELFTLNPGAVATRNYSSQFNIFEFIFGITAPGVEISVWGKDKTGNVTAVHRLVAGEVKLFYS